jgi:hypothetical protein
MVLLGGRNVPTGELIRAVRAGLQRTGVNLTAVADQPQ